MSSYYDVRFYFPTVTYQIFFAKSKMKKKPEKLQREVLIEVCIYTKRKGEKERLRQMFDLEAV